MDKIFYYFNEIINFEKEKSDLRYNIYKVFEDNNIEIAFPQRIVWIKKSN
tara:strand:+ start:303 stop:452 length:150 start_codon:yes stop_codon:yes gene_type:complete